jgi:hypothetical protein
MIVQLSGYQKVKIVKGQPYKVGAGLIPTDPIIFFKVVTTGP